MSHAAPHIGHSSNNPYPSVGWNHPRKLSGTARTIFVSTWPSTLTSARPGNSMLIVPGGCSALTDSRTCSCTDSSETATGNNCRSLFVASQEQFPEGRPGTACARLLRVRHPPRLYGSLSGSCTSRQRASPLRTIYLLTGRAEEAVGRSHQLPEEVAEAGAGHVAGHVATDLRRRSPHQ
jgi:hypothetical protein